MSVELSELTDQAMLLSAAERLELATKLWDSLEQETVPVDVEQEALELARHRSSELSAGTAQGVDHDDVIEKGRRALGCE